jgi:hypothetical protein
MIPVKKLVLLVTCCLTLVVALAQNGQDSLSRLRRDSIKREQRRDSLRKTLQPRPDSTVKKPGADTAEHRTDSAVALVVPDSAIVVPSVPADSSRVVIRAPNTPPKPSVTPPAAVLLTLPPPENSVAGFQKALRQHPYYNFYGKGVLVTAQLKKAGNDELMFYFLAALLAYFGLFRVIFTRYFDNLRTLFFRVTMRQQQIRDQLLQSPLPSLFLNILFVISGALFMSIAVYHYNIVPGMNRWLLLLYCAILLAAIYVGKFIILKLIGWMFNIRMAADTYIFIVFLVNKMLGIYLLPALMLMAFAEPEVVSVLLTICFILLIILFIYRFIIAFRPIRNEIKITRFQFFLYICAFEIAPLLLIYKVLLMFVERSY